MKKTYLFLAFLMMLIPSVLRAQTDMTSAITNADLSSNEGWTISCTAGQAWATQAGGGSPFVSEAYAGWGALEMTEFSMTQDITLAKGYYSLKGFAFYRQGENFATNPTKSNAVLFAGEEEVKVATLGSIEGLGTYANGVGEASAQFAAGNYLNEVRFNVMEETATVTIGFKGNHDEMRSWFICGPLTLEQIATEPYIPGLEETVTAYNEALAAAQALDAKMSAEARLALETAIATTVDMEDVESIKAATKAITNATDAAKASINAYEGVAAYLAKMGAVLDLTNVYTAESYAAAVTDVQTAWSDGTFTTDQAAAYSANSAYNTVWHSNNFIDDVLLSSWSIGGEACSEYTKALYINTWSTEANKDGSNMHTPFFEYWTGDANTLGDNTLSATVTDLTPGEYYVEVLARVRRTNGVEDAPTGITMSANGGEAVDLCAGTQSTVEGFNQMFYGTFGTTCTVGEDGVMNIEIKVEGANCSWIAFKNVKYYTAAEKEAIDLQAAYEAAMAAITPANFYQIVTEVDGTPYYLTNAGTLTANADEAYSFKFTTVDFAGTKYPLGWNVSVAFTNPTLDGGSSGNIVQKGALQINSKNNRNDWERQVFFLQDGKYAVRSTNANSVNWGANTYWDAVTDAELPQAGYSLTPQYRWTLKDVTALATLAEATAIIEAKDGVGTGLFMKSEADFAALETATAEAKAVIESETATPEEIAAATAALQAAIATYVSAPLIAPDPAKAYTIQQKASGLFMALNETNVIITAEENASQLFFEAGENGGYYIKTADDLYVGMTGANNWTMSTTADNKREWKISYVGDNYYKITKMDNANHSVGTNDAELSDGSFCYADKKTANNVMWAFIPVPEPVYEAVELTAADYHVWTAADATGEQTETTPYFMYNVGVANGNVYGNSNVVATEYARLNDCKALIVNVAAEPEARPRFLINRPTNDSHDYINIPNNDEQTAKYLTTEVKEDGTTDYIIDVAAIVADYGYCHLHAIKGADWKDVLVNSIKALRPALEPIEINFERIAGMGYSGDQVPYDEAAILAALGVASWEEVTTMVPMVMTTGEAGVYEYDGWCSVDGDPMQWVGDGAGLGLCLKKPENGAFALCTHPGNDPAVGTTLSAAWIFGAATGRTVTVKVNVTFIEAPAITFNVVGTVNGSVTYSIEEGTYTKKVVTFSEEYQQTILEALGVESFESITAYGYNPTTEEFIATAVANSYDGWRAPSGDFAYHSGDATVPACVKYVDGISYECYNIQVTEAMTIPTYWALASGENAVLVKIEFIFSTVPVGIDNIASGMNNKVQKVLRDGKVVIIKGDKVFNMGGATIK